MNSRPLTHLPVHPDDLCPITPNYLIKQHPGYAFVDDSRQNKDDDVQHMTIQAKKISDKLSQRWTKEFLPEITKSDVRRRNNKGLEVGDYVIYTDPNVKPGNWQKGLIINTYKSRDNFARIADVKLLNGEILEKRSVVRLAKLEIDEKSHKSCDENKILLSKGVENPLNTAQLEISNFEESGSELTLNPSVKLGENLLKAFLGEKSEGKMELPENLDPECAIKLMTELGEAKFLTRAEIKKGKDQLARDLRKLTRDSFHEDLENMRTVRIAHLPVSCCFASIIAKLSDCSKAVQMGNLMIDDAVCRIQKAQNPKRVLSIKKAEVSVISFNPVAIDSNDRIVIARMRDKPSKFCAVPTLTNDWLVQYRQYKRRLEAIIPVVKAQKANDRIVVDFNQINDGVLGRSIQLEPTIPSISGCINPKNSHPTVPDKMKLKSIIVVPNHSTFKPVSINMNHGKKVPEDSDEEESSDYDNFKR
jgi:hypothetical protein